MPQNRSRMIDNRRDGTTLNTDGAVGSWIELEGTYLCFLEAFLEEG